ncbi:TIMELESS-interacting protein-like isoform X2 [Limulus polyphemus]|nr:TIMELESS-interacting protein-like isoform X2 [Limulus polyphemus]XP_022252915.1 TIMELESS-interacting protein-like isoform X2 [Limulus polyphemus]
MNADDLENLFDEDENLDELHTAENEDDTQEDNQDVRNEDGDVNTASQQPVEAKKKIVRNPLPKLDADRLCGKRGIALLPKVFEKVTFKGKGYETNDLDKMMAILEHWAHRLYPRLPFSDVLERIEKLGAKRPVQTCIRRIRADMPIFSEDFVGEGGEEEEEDTVRRQQDDKNTEDIFEDLLREQEIEAELNTGHEMNRYETESFQTLRDLPASLEHPSIPQDCKTPTNKVSLTEEQKEKIERNKQIAEERRKQKLQAQENDHDITNMNTLKVGSPMVLNVATPVTQVESNLSHKESTSTFTEESFLLPLSVTTPLTQVDSNSSYERTTSHFVEDNELEITGTSHLPLSVTSPEGCSGSFCTNISSLHCASGSLNEGLSAHVNSDSKSIDPGKDNREEKDKQKINDNFLTEEELLREMECNH